METLNEIWETISRHKLRTAVTAFSVSWGIFMLVLLLAMGNGLGKGVSKSFSDNAMNSIRLFSGNTSLPYQGMPKNRSIRLNYLDYEQIKSQVPGIEYISARVDRWGSERVTFNNKSAGFSLRGVNPDFRIIEKTEVIKGRYINDEDIRLKRKVVVIGKPVEETLFKGADPLGQFLSVSGIMYKVVGVFTDDGGDRENNMVHIPISLAQLAYNMGNEVNAILITTQTNGLEASENLKTQAKNILASAHRFDPNDPSAIHAHNNYATYLKFYNVIVFVKYFVGFVGIMTLIAGVVGVGNILLITVKERTKEFGVRKALGATPLSIISLVMLESIFITFVSGYMGMLAGIGVLELINNNFPDMGYLQSPSIDLGIAVMALFLLVITGALTGLLPAYRASTINPIEALRAE